MYWIGRNEQASIRADSEIVNWLEYDAEVWLTTWGGSMVLLETISRCYEFSHDLVDNKTILFKLLETVACESSNPEAFDIPTTWMIDVANQTIEDVKIEGESVEEMGQVKNLQNGWRVENGLLLLSVQHNP